MTKPTKIALSASRDIPFNQLVLSQSNVRRVKAGVSIDALATDIARRGLLQSLTVRAQRDESGAETGKFEVPAGGRRFRALQQLVKAKRLSRTAPVPCIVREDDEISAEEDSLAENTHREALHPLDQFRAMQQLAGQGCLLWLDWSNSQTCSWRAWSSDTEKAMSCSSVIPSSA